MRTPVALPDTAKSKLRDLELAKMAAEDAMRGSAMRLNGLPINTDPELRDRLAAEQQRQGHRHSQLSQLVSRCHQWLAELPRDSVLEAAPVSDVDLTPGAVEAVRSEIATLRQQLATVRSASLPVSDQKELAEQYVVRLMRQAKVGVAVVRDELKLNFRGDMFSPEDVLALLAWSHPDAVCRALEREIDRLPEQPNAMAKPERERKVAELAAELLERERVEESLIMAAAAVGQEVLRRVDASPIAVLMLNVNVVAPIANSRAVEATAA